MKTTWKKLLALALALTMAFALCACGAQPAAPAADANTGSNEAPAETAGRTETITFRVGWPTSGQEGDVIMPGIMAVTDYVTEKSGGTIQFEYFPNQQLGTENDMTDSLITGDLDIGVISNTVAATYWPELYPVADRRAAHSLRHLPCRRLLYERRLGRHHSRVGAAAAVPAVQH